jgi:uncharacterized protein (TIRG00374 family)
LQIGFLSSSFIIAIILIHSQVMIAEIQFGSLWQKITAASPWLILLSVLTTVLHLTISALKWRLVMQAATARSGDNPPFSFHLYYTCLGDVFAQIVPVSLSIPIVRTIGARLYPGQRAVRAMGSSLYEQSFDLFVLLVFALPGLLWITGNVTTRQWIGLQSGALILGGVLVSLFARQIFRFGATILGRLSRWIRLLHKSHAAVDAIARSDLPSMWLSSRLFSLAVIRLCALIIRAYAAAKISGLEVGLLDLTGIMPLAQFAMLLSITPGNLGITEWTWTGLLVAFGAVSLQAASEFALVHRIVAYLSVLLFSSLVFAGTLARKTPDQSKNDVPHLPEGS